MWVLVLFRLVASLGIGGEWAAGAAMVAEVVPEKRRVEAGALLYTSAPLGLLLAGYVTHLIQGVLMPGDPTMAWRYVFLCGLVPAAIAFLVRIFVKEPERWQKVAAQAKPRVAEIFGPKYRAITVSGSIMAFIALATWWSSNAFLPTIVSALAQQVGADRHLDAKAVVVLTENMRAEATNWFNLGGLLGTLLTIPVAKHFGRKPMFFLYYLFSGLAIIGAFGLPMPPQIRLMMYFVVGLTTFGVFGSFTYYLPELFPTRLRGTGAGFCYNLGRFVAAGGPFLVGSIASRGAAAGGTASQVLVWVGAVPLLGLLLMPWVVETKDRPLPD
jgi:MFS family permease